MNEKGQATLSWRQRTFCKAFVRAVLGAIGVTNRDAI
jgi:hypothetical protein